MPGQLSFAGFEAAPQLTDRLFFAVLPDSAAAARITALAQQVRGQHGLTGMPLPAERLHVTLQFLGDHAGVPRRLVDAASQAAASLSVPAFGIALDHVLSFQGGQRKPLVLCGGAGVTALVEFHSELGEALAAAAVPCPASASYTPHVTLLYDERAIARQPVEPVRWVAGELVLVNSLVGRSRHVVLGRWPLRPRL